MIAARSADSFQGSLLTVSGRSGGESWERSLMFAPPPSGFEQAYTGIGTIWARARIASLMDELILGREEAEVRAEVLPVALKHQLVSRFTSFVALEQAPSRAPDAALRTKPVPNLRPLGQSPQSYAYPRTATASRLHLALGLALLFAACVFWRWPASGWR
jgi:Ca-activated chloride channel family protein